MAADELLKPTLHVEVLLKGTNVTSEQSSEIRAAVGERLVDICDAVKVGQSIDGFRGIQHEDFLGGVVVADYTGPENSTGTYELQNVRLDTQTYVLKDEWNADARRIINQTTDDDRIQTRTLALPNAQLHEEWDSLVFEDALPARLLRYLVRMVSMMRQPGLTLSTFNWNRLCLLHGPPGSGKSTLCRALAQKLSIRLGDIFAKATLVEINTNAMLSKYFGESGKLISGTFERIHALAQDQSNFVCVIMDEVEILAGSREMSARGNECRDGLRATDQLLMALDRFRVLPNVIFLCTSNLIEAIDAAFVDRVDIKQLVPSPSPAAIYNIFRSCLNELVRSSLVDATASEDIPSSVSTKTAPSAPPSRQPVARSGEIKTNILAPQPSSSPDPWTVVYASTIPTLSETKLCFSNQPNSPAFRVWTLARKCEGFSGRTLRRLPILGLAMYTWGGHCSLDDAVSALEAAVEQEFIAMSERKKER